MLWGEKISYLKRDLLSGFVFFENLGSLGVGGVLQSGGESGDVETGRERKRERK